MKQHDIEFGLIVGSDSQVQNAKSDQGTELEVDGIEQFLDDSAFFSNLRVQIVVWHIYIAGCLMFY